MKLHFEREDHGFGVPRLDRSVAVMCSKPDVPRLPWQIATVYVNSPMKIKIKGLLETRALALLSQAVTAQVFEDFISGEWEWFSFELSEGKLCILRGNGLTMEVM